jgi:hypothetical protein
MKLIATLPKEIQQLILMFAAKPQNDMLLEDIQNYVNTQTTLYKTYQTLVPDSDYTSKYWLRSDMCYFFNNNLRLRCYGIVEGRLWEILQRQRKRTLAIPNPYYNVNVFFRKYYETKDLNTQIRLIMGLLLPLEREEFVTFVNTKLI